MHNTLACSVCLTSEKSIFSNNGLHLFASYCLPLALASLLSQKSVLHEASLFSEFKIIVSSLTIRLCDTCVFVILNIIVDRSNFFLKPIFCSLSFRKENMFRVFTISFFLNPFYRIQ